MTAAEILVIARSNDIAIAVQGDRLIVDAPPGALTPELRAELARHKAALLALLAPVTEFVDFKGGLVLPLPAVQLALDLERRGFKMSLDACQQVQLEPTAVLTETDLAAIRRWRLHLGAIITYEADGHDRPQ
jgi:hypothetical protein